VLHVQNRSDVEHDAPAAAARRVRHADVDAELEQLLDPGRSFPSPQLVRAAADLFVVDGDLRPGLYSGPVRLAAAGGYSQTPNAAASDDRRAEGRDFLVQVSGGVVGLRMVDHERRARTEARTILSRELARYNETTGRYEVVLRRPTRVINSWSRKSRARMTRTLSELDYAPLFAAGRAPAMVTLTYPGDWQTVAPSGRAVKKHVEVLMLRWKRAWAATPAFLWKLEFQRRGAPHLHLFVVPPGEHSDFRAWLSATWADIVAHPDLEERHRHQLAGTGIDYREGVRARDPKRLAVYFTKHGGAAGGKEYQHQVPMEWRTPERGPGRFWGYRGLRRVRCEIYVDVETYVQLRRTLRRLSRSRKLSRTSRVPRVDTTTGVITWRTVTRRLVHLDHGGLAGGFLLVNDGPATASALSRLGPPG
jgi:hypothetical protein